MARRMPNVVVLDATVIGASGIAVPGDIDNTDLDNPPRGYDFSEFESYPLSRAVKSDWAVKIMNDGDADVDAVPMVGTSDDPNFTEHIEDGPEETVTTGTPPDNVGLFSGETIAGHLGVVLSADPAPTAGTVTVVFNTRLYGGA